MAGQQRSIQAVRDQLAEAAAPRQRPATRPGVNAAATPGRAAAAGVTLLSPPDGRPWTPRSSGRIIPSRFTSAQWGNQALIEFRAGRGDAALAAVDNAAALDPDHRDRWAALRRRIRELRTVPAGTPLLDNGDIDESTPEARRVGFEARVTAAWGSPTPAQCSCCCARPEWSSPRWNSTGCGDDPARRPHCRDHGPLRRPPRPHRPPTPPPSRDVLATAGALHNRNGLADHGGIVAASPHTAHTDAARQDSVAPSTAGSGGGCRPGDAAGTLRLDGPMRQLVADTPPPGADVVDGATRTGHRPGGVAGVADRAACGLRGLPGLGSGGCGGRPGRLLNQAPGQDASAHLHSGTSADSARAPRPLTPASRASRERGRIRRPSPPRTVSRRVPPPASSDGATAVDGAAVRPAASSARPPGHSRRGRGAARCDEQHQRPTHVGSSNSQATSRPGWYRRGKPPAHPGDAVTLSSSGTGGTTPALI